MYVISHMQSQVFLRNKIQLCVNTSKHTHQYLNIKKKKNEKVCQVSSVMGIRLRLHLQCFKGFCVLCDCFTTNFLIGFNTQFVAKQSQEA